MKPHGMKPHGMKPHGMKPRADIADLPIPVPASPRAAMLAVPRQGRRWPGVARATVAVALPGLIGVALGAGAVSAVATLGAFAVVYGEGLPYRVRWRTVTIVGVVLVALAGIGAAVGSVVHDAVTAGGSVWWPMALVLTMTVVVATCAFVVDAVRSGPPGAFLLLLALEIASALPSVGVSVGATVAWTAIGAATALVVAVSGLPFRPRTPERAAVAAAVATVAAVSEENSPVHRRAAVRDLHAAWQCLHDAGLVGSGHPLDRMLRAAHVRCATALHGADHDGADRDEATTADDLRWQIPLRRPSIRHRLVRAAHPRGRSATIVLRLLVAGPAAGAIAIGLDLGRPDWAVITATMILHQGPDRILGTYRAAHRFVGTVFGLVLLAGLSLFDLRGAVLIAVLAAAMAGIEAFLVRNYSLAMVFITPIAMILGVLGTPGDLVAVSWDRFVETVVGVVVALAVMWGVLPRSHRRILVDADSQVSDTISRITRVTDAGELPELRRDLEFDLHASTAAAITAAHTEPVWTRERWPAHRRLHELGYRILTAPRSPRIR